MEDNDKLESNEPKQNAQEIRKAIDIEARSRWLTSITGYVMTLGAIALFGLLAWNFLGVKVPDAPGTGSDIYAYLIQHFGDDVLVLIGAVFLTIVGMRLLGQSGKGVPTIIPPDDRELLEPLIKDGKKDAIELYIKLSALGGFTGTFQKVGFTGLPLATAIITLIFSGLSFWQIEFLELAKLTLGAFIGSFVQKGTDISSVLHKEDAGQISAGGARKPSTAAPKS